MQFRGMVSGAFLVALFSLAPDYALAACPQAGEVEITSAEERAKATAAGIPTSANCWNPNNPYAGKDAAEAKKYLDTLWCSPQAGRCGSYKSTVTDLNPKFASCIAEFLRKARNTDPSICLNSAYRSSAHQACACQNATVCAAPGRSKHQQGLAVDVRARDYGWLHAEVRKFGGLRHLSDPRDPYHIESDGTLCADGTYKPTDTPAAASPSAQFAQTVRQALGMQPAQQAAPAQQATPSQQLAQSQSPLSSFDSSVSTPLVSNSLLSSSPLSTTTPIADRLEQLAFNRPASTSPTSVAVPLVINPNDRGGVTSAPRPTEGTGVAWIGAGITQNTFTQQAPAPSYAAPTNATTYQTILMSLRNILQTMLAYLRPFGRQQSAEIHFE